MIVAVLVAHGYVQIIVAVRADNKRAAAINGMHVNSARKRYKLQSSQRRSRGRSCMTLDLSTLRTAASSGITGFCHHSTKASPTSAVRTLQVEDKRAAFVIGARVPIRL